MGIPRSFRFNQNYFQMRLAPFCWITEKCPPIILENVDYFILYIVLIAFGSCVEIRSLRFTIILSDTKFWTQKSIWTSSFQILTNGFFIFTLVLLAEVVVVEV
jgi:hypothetical protein